MIIACDNPHHDAGQGVCVFCVQGRIDEAVKVERDRLVAWAKEKGRGHRELAIKRQDAGDDEMASQHIAIESAYFSLADEIRKRDSQGEDKA